MTIQPHPWRCRTCETKDCEHYVPLEWRIVGDPLYEGTQRGHWEITAKFGCASHSGFKKMLETMRSKALEYDRDGIPECGSKICSVDDEPCPCIKCIINYVIDEQLKEVNNKCQ